MENIVTEFAKYLLVLLMTMYTLYCFTVFRNNNKARQKRVFFIQSFIMLLIHFVSHMVLYINSYNVKIIVLYGIELAFFIVSLVVYQKIYKRLSRLVLNNMLMLLMISFVMLTRLSYNKAIKQLAFACGIMLICLVVPVIIEKFKYLKNFGWFYGLAGLILLMMVLAFGSEVYGATNWITIAGFGFQPSEFVKILFVFFAASLLSKSTAFFDVVKVSAVAAIHVLVLVAEKDLGGALIFFVTYLLMLYVASCKPLYLISGLLGGSMAAFLAYKVFDHVKVRVLAWSNPWSVIDNEGYQITQSLFAIGTGSWFGLGLTKGLPTSIPVVDTDFIFSAVSEELGGIFAICIVLICISCFVMFVNISMKMRKLFYKLVALGLSIIYIFQVFLSIGGVTKFIPSTGVTLPLVSYGGSSIISTIILFSVIQGLYVLNQDEVEKSEKIKKREEFNKNIGY